MILKMKKFMALAMALSAIGSVVSYADSTPK